MGENDITLARLPIGGVARVHSILSNGPERRRMLDLGLIEGTKIQALLRSPSGNPVAYLIRGALIALREDDSSGIMVTPGDSDPM
jgi:ferrous iron transport protein A